MFWTNAQGINFVFLNWFPEETYPFVFSKFLISIEKIYSKNEGEIPVKMAS